MVGTFQDPLTRQLSEAVKIEHAGPELLNSKSEYSRCRVPRLRIDMEGWRKGKEKEDEQNNVDPLVEEQDHEGALLEIEQEERRNNQKRKDEGSHVGRKKKTKLPRLEGWGEGGEDSSQEITTGDIKNIGKYRTTEFGGR